MVLGGGKLCKGLRMPECLSCSITARLSIYIMQTRLLGLEYPSGIVSSVLCGRVCYIFVMYVFGPIPKRNVRNAWTREELVYK